MLKSRKMLVIPLVILAMTISLFTAGCGQKKAENNSAASETKTVEKNGEQTKADNTSSGTQKKYRFTLVSPCTAHPIWVKTHEGAIRAAEEFGVDLDIVGPPTVNIDEQIKAIETAIAQKVDGILTDPLNPETFTPIINKAVEAGILVTCLDTDAPNSKRLSYAGTNNREGGKTVGKTIAKLMNGTANIGILTGFLDNTTQNERIEGLKEVMKDYPNMKIVTIEATNGEQLKAAEKAQTMLKAYPEINVVFGVGGGEAVAAGNTVQEMNLVGKIKIIGWDDMEEERDLIKKGVITACIAQNQYKQAYLGIKHMKLAKDGEKNIPSVVDTGTTVLDINNYNSWQPSID